MSRVNRLSGVASFVAVGIVALLIGGTLGTATAVVPSLIGAPSAIPESGNPPKPDPDYPTNVDGLTYGSAFDANSPENEPDLIAVLATNGKEGYVLKSELDAASGSNMPSREAAIEWTNNGAKLDHVVKVYTVDGKTQIGEFIVYGTDSLKSQLPVED